MAYSDDVLADSPLVYLRLNETTPGTGTAADSSGNGNNGTYVASPTSVTGLLKGDTDKAVDFNGTTQWVTSAINMYPVLSQRTFEIVARRRTSTTADTIMASDRATNRCTWSFASGSDNITFFPDSGVGGLTFTNAAPKVGDVGHMVITFDGSTKVAELFVNGSSKGQQTATNDYAGNANYNLAVSGAGNNPMDGALDEFAIYNGILSAARIGVHAASALRLEHAPVPHLPFH